MQSEFVRSRTDGPKVYKYKYDIQYFLYIAVLRSYDTVFSVYRSAT